MNERISKDTKALMLSNIIQGLLSTGEYTYLHDDCIQSDENNRAIEGTDHGMGFYKMYNGKNWRADGFSSKFTINLIDDARVLLWQAIDIVE